jgi:hypothetical protein
MGKCFLLALAVLASGSPATAGEEPQADVKALRARISELETANLGLERQVAELRNLLEEVLDEKARDVRARKVPLEFDGRPDPPHLRGLRLPFRPSKEQVRAYVSGILRAAGARRGHHSGADPEVRLLEQVGPDHVDILTEPLLYQTRSEGELYLIEALRSLVTDAHKDLVLARFPLCRALVRLVVAKGWTRDAAPELLRGLAERASWKSSEGGSGLAPEWIEAVASLERPESYHHLKVFFYADANRYHTWSAVRHLPGVLLDSDVAAVWKWAKEKRKPGYERDAVAAVAAHHGHFDALEELFVDPGEWPAAEAIANVTPYDGGRSDAEQARRWFRKNRSRLEFDAVSRRYVVKE